MTTEIQMRGDAPLSAMQIRANVNLIQEVMRDVMKDTIHFGKIPGCGDKPALLKAGAEKIMATFRIAPEVITEDLSSHDEIRYRIRVRGMSATGVFLGEGVGECSSNEDKFKWRRATCPQEFEETAADRRRRKWTGGSKPYQIDQVRTNPSDVANTVLKMGKKRALVDMVLTVTAASDVFEQDIEEMDLEPREAPAAPLQRPQPKPPVQSPAAAQAAAPPQQQPPPADGDVISDPQRKRFWAIAKNAGLSDDAIKTWLTEHYSIASTKAIPKFLYEEICAKIAEPAEPGSEG